MKVISKKTFEVSVVAPETPEEQREIQRVITEVRSERIEPGEWKIVDNRPGSPASGPSSQVP